MLNNSPEVVSVYDGERYIYIVFSSKKLNKIKEKFDKLQLIEALRENNKALLEKLSHSSEILSFRIEQRHAYDIVCIDKKDGLLEVRVDKLHGCLRIHRPMRDQQGPRLSVDESPSKA